MSLKTYSVRGWGFVGFLIYFPCCFNIVVLSGLIFFILNTISLIMFKQKSSGWINRLGPGRLFHLGQLQSFTASRISCLCSLRNRSILENLAEVGRKKKEKRVSLAVSPSSASILFLSLMHSCHQGVGCRSASLQKSKVTANLSL